MRGDSRRSKKKRKRSLHDELSMPNAGNNNFIAGRDGGQDIPIQNLEMPEPENLDLGSESIAPHMDELLDGDRNRRALIDAGMPKNPRRKFVLKTKIPQKIRSLLKGNRSDNPINRLKLPKSSNEPGSEV
jgi:hypothetical protein